MEDLITDAGHGGKDNGTTNFGYVEKELNLVVTKRVNQLLGITNTTRNFDTNIEPNDRTDLIKNKYKYAISIHFNAGGGNGIEAIHSVHSTKGKELAKSIVDEMHRTTGIPLRTTPVFSKTLANGSDYYYMHRNTGSTITVIVECMFLDNIENIKKLNIEQIAQGIASGFKKFITGGEDVKPLLVYNRALKRGLKGDDVKALQVRLKELGFYIGEIDGSFGLASDKAVRAFQSANTLVVDGSVGQATIKALNEIGKK